MDCELCGAAFVPRKKTSRFCSQTCSARAARPRVILGGQRVTCDVLRSNVSPGTKLVWLYMRLAAEGATAYRFNVREASRDLGVSTATVWRAIYGLRDLGMIAWQPTGGGGWGEERCGLLRFIAGARVPDGRMSYQNRRERARSQ